MRLLTVLIQRMEKQVQTYVRVNHSGYELVIHELTRYTEMMNRARALSEQQWGATTMSEVLSKLDLNNLTEQVGKWIEEQTSSKINVTLHRFERLKLGSADESMLISFHVEQDWVENAMARLRDNHTSASERIEPQQRERYFVRVADRCKVTGADGESSEKVDVEIRALDSSKNYTYQAHLEGRVHRDVELGISRLTGGLVLQLPVPSEGVGDTDWLKAFWNAALSKAVAL